jgi:hypothetical protein
LTGKVVSIAIGREGCLGETNVLDTNTPGETIEIGPGTNSESSILPGEELGKTHFSLKRKVRLSFFLFQHYGAINIWRCLCFTHSLSM